MTMNRDLFLAILSMDSYNRGYGVGVKGLSETGRLGNATIREFADGEQKGSQADGFYALAYDMTGMANGGAFADGETVIAFRGTNFVLNPSFFQSPAWDDIINGSTVSAGGTGLSGFSSIAGRQARLAIEFYRAATGNTPYDAPGNDNAALDRIAA